MPGSLPRSRSEYVIKVKTQHVQNGSKDVKTLSASSPELRSMLINLNTTVPQNLHPETLSSTHSPRRRRGRCKIPSMVEMISCCATSSRCSVRIFLIIIQIVVGCAITAVCTYVHLFVPAMRQRDKPFWAGVPLLLAGLSGIFFIERDRKKEEGSTALFILKTACSALATISTFVCVTAAVFASIHVGQLYTYAYCRHLSNACLCFYSYSANSKSHLYSPMEDCVLVDCQVKILLITLGSLAVFGGLASLFFVISVWKSRYGEINTEAE